MIETKFLLPESAIPSHWYNVAAALPAPPEPPRGADGRILVPQALETRIRRWAHGAPWRRDRIACTQAGPS